MSDLVFPSELSGYAWDSKKKPVFSTISQSPVTGRDVRIALYRQPIYEFMLSNVWMDTADKNSLIAFFVARKGVLDSFLYADEDCDVSNQFIGAGNGVITTFQLIKNTGTAVEWVCNPAPNAQIYVAGALKTATTDYVINWKGEVIFVAAPAVGAVISWSGVAYYRCVFLANELEVSQFANLLYECGEIGFKGGFGLNDCPCAVGVPVDVMAGLLWELPCIVMGNTGLFCSCQAEANNRGVIVGQDIVYDITLRFRGIAELSAFNGTGVSVATYLREGVLNQGNPTNRYILNIVNQYGVNVQYGLNWASPFQDATAIDYLYTFRTRGNSIFSLAALSIDNSQSSNYHGSVVADDDPLHPLRVTQPYNGQFIQADVISVVAV
jgi:uncharacterized protein (TIGR02217 family)